MVGVWDGVDGLVDLSAAISFFGDDDDDGNDDEELAADDTADDEDEGFLGIFCLGFCANIRCGVKASWFAHGLRRNECLAVQRYKACLPDVDVS